MYLKYNYVPLAIFSCKLSTYMSAHYNYETAIEIMFTFEQTWTFENNKGVIV